MKKNGFPTAEPFLPDQLSISSMKKASKECRGCDLYKNATQTVFGDGSRHAELVIVGEQPGDHEDQEGHPFVGPAGKMLNRILEEAGINRTQIYVTNAVKHFKFSRAGKRRIHQKPNAAEIHACHPWLESELKVLKPKIVVCLGATAARAVFGKLVTIGAHRGRFHRTSLSSYTYVTVHPSALIRIPDHDAKEDAIKEAIQDFRIIKRQLEKLATKFSNEVTLE